MRMCDLHVKKKEEKQIINVILAANGFSQSCDLRTRYKSAIQQLHGVFTVRVRVSVTYRGVKFEV